MDEITNYAGLVQRAQLGDQECLGRLSELVRGRLYAYIFRIVLRDDVAQDIVQESMTEMVKILGKLEKADRFWPWLRGIAFNKLRGHYSKQERHRTVSMSNMAEEDYSGDDGGQEGLTNLVSNELKQIVITAMEQLKSEHRKVLVMRCYEQMGYSEIAELMGGSELGMRMLFYRAKKSLTKQLRRSGFGKGAFLSALILFGKLTAPSEAAAAGLTVTPATLKVGTAVSLMGMASSPGTVVSLKVGAVSLVAAGGIYAGTAVPTTWVDKTAELFDKNKLTRAVVVQQPAEVKEVVEEYWYYYPTGRSGPVMTRMVKKGSDGRNDYNQFLQDDLANYYYDKAAGTIYIRNCRIWQVDMSVRQLPCDGQKLRGFLMEVEGQDQGSGCISDGGDGLLVIVRRQGGVNHLQTMRHYNLLEEEYFRYNWPAAQLVDGRDLMHKRGWTYFRVAGELNGKKVSGTGCLPFVYNSFKENRPWLKLKIGDNLKIADNAAAANVYDSHKGVFRNYEGGVFFTGLGRPWMGVHTIDTIRRDAAEQWMKFETKLTVETNKAEIVLSYGAGALVYTIDMDKDIVEKVEFRGKDGQVGEFRFSYLEDIGDVGLEFAPPRIKESEDLNLEDVGIKWLIELAEDRLVKK